MALVRINRNGTYYETYHVSNALVSSERERLVKTGLSPFDNGDEPSNNSFSITMAALGVPSLADRFHLESHVA